MGCWLCCAICRAALFSLPTPNGHKSPAMSSSTNTLALHLAKDERKESHSWVYTLTHQPAHISSYLPIGWPSPMSPKYIAGPISSRSNARFIPHMGNKVPLGIVKTASTYLNKIYKEHLNNASILERKIKEQSFWNFSVFKLN